MAALESSIAGKRCLVVDDQFLIAMDIRQIVEGAGAKSVVCVATGEEALAALDSGAIDFAILDVKLGGELPTSMSIAARLAAEGTPFVFLTGVRIDDPVFRQFPDTPVIEKPYDVTALLAAIRRAIEQRGS